MPIRFAEIVMPNILSPCPNSHFPGMTDSNIFDLPIFNIRGQRILLDTDLARIYEVPTKRFNEAFKRNSGRFPSDFAFQLTEEETINLRSQFATSRSEVTAVEGVTKNWSQFATSSNRHRGLAYFPWAFTEHGAIMAANILRSQRAVQMSVYVVRAFVRLREQITSNQAILKRLAEIDKTLLQHDGALRDIYHKLLPLLSPPPEGPPKRRIGFQKGA
jgi:hypothetical protein